MTGFTHEPPAGGTPEWYTPPWVFAALGVNFDLDPCAPPLPAAAWIPARRRYTLAEDGFAQAWEGRIWLNPPYTMETARWIGKLSEHGDGIALVFTRLDTPWAQSALAIATAVCFIRGRVEFVPGSGAKTRRSDGRSRPGAPSMLIAFGEGCAEAVLGSGLGVAFAGAASPPQLQLGAAAA